MKINPIRVLFLFPPDWLGQSSGGESDWGLIIAAMPTTLEDGKQVNVKQLKHPQQDTNPRPAVVKNTPVDNYG